jgi:hypothetical protein
LKTAPAAQAGKPGPPIHKTFRSRVWAKGGVPKPELGNE